jgi:hypothetical protein
MFWRKRSTDDFAEEIKAHLGLEADELKREGLSEDEARRKARREFGNVRAAQERFYMKGRWVWLDSCCATYVLVYAPCVQAATYSDGDGWGIADRADECSDASDGAEREPATNGSGCCSRRATGDAGGTRTHVIPVWGKAV